MGGQSGGASSGDAAQLAAHPNSPGDADSLQGRLQPVKLAGSRAGKLADRNFLVTKGSMIDCPLGARLDSTVPGIVSCYVTRAELVALGQVILMPRNSKVTGSYGPGPMAWDCIRQPRHIIQPLVIGRQPLSLTARP